MDIQSLLVFLLVGLVAGWLADLVVRNGFGLLGDLIIGVLGSFIGGWLFGQLGITTGGILGNILTAFIGAIILLAVLILIRGRR